MSMEDNQDIVMNGKLLYRYSLDQIELEGYWCMSNDQLTQEKFSYLLLKKPERMQYKIRKEEYGGDRDYNINICGANMFETILIPHAGIFNTIITYLTGEYHGFFMYYDKTIEDRFFINFIHDDNQVRLSGNNIIIY
jgi:hypothetical protein